MDINKEVITYKKFLDIVCEYVDATNKYPVRKLINKSQFFNFKLFSITRTCFP